MTATLLRRLKKLEQVSAENLEADRPLVWGVDTFTVEQFRKLLREKGFPPDACVSSCEPSPDSGASATGAGSIGGDREDF